MEISACIFAIFRSYSYLCGGKSGESKVESGESKVESGESKVESRESRVERRKSRVESGLVNPLIIIINEIH